MKYKRKTKESVLRNRRYMFFIISHISSTIDISALEGKKKKKKKKLLSIVRNEDHCEHNAIEKENQQFDNKLKEEKKRK
jgi:hypothetical protein